ncbi:carboxypeptidase-like regulatory domain-containing protein [Algoriphagus sp.]|uniref:carboxypeptidase-like regulatory domain-containing protein n=1 Tax=Algoriphagus sp. TaxID=1872435 RepID=UPI003F6F6853
MRFLVFSFFFLCVHFVKAQNQQANSISGVIIDREDSAPVQFAYLYLKNYPDFSALADEQGEFKFFFPSQFSDETLVISCIGYEKKEVIISSLSATANKLSLQRQLLSLNEVMVMPEGNSIEEMISKAIDNIPKNYPDKRHQLRGFYRKVSTNYEEFTKLVEAAVLVEDVSYQKDGYSGAC